MEHDVRFVQLYHHGWGSTSTFQATWRYNCLSMWMAGFGAKRGFSLGRPDDDCSNVTANRVHMHDLQATILRCVGVDHRQLRYKYQGRVFRRTDVSGEAACAYRYT